MGYVCRVHMVWGMHYLSASCISGVCQCWHAEVLVCALTAS